MNNDKSKDDDILKLKNGFDSLFEAIENIANRPPQPSPIPKRSLSGDHINGGKISQFESTGIKDSSTKLSLVVTDKGITTKYLKAEALLGDSKVKGSLTVEGDAEVDGDLKVKKLYVDELVADTRIERSSPLEFYPDNSGIYGKGIFWKGEGSTRQLIYRANPDRLWTTEILDLNSEAFYSIDNTPVLRKNELGSSVRKSYLTEVGTLQNLKTQGNLIIDDYIHYVSEAQRLGFGTESPNGTLSVVSLDSEFIIDVEGTNSKIGNYTTDNLEIVTDDTARITISKTGNIVIGSNYETKTTIQGKLGINVKNPDVDISTVNAVRFQGKKFEVSDSSPLNGNYDKGDIVWNSDPKPTGYVGWICIREGNPGEWRPFGQISQ